MSNEIDVLFGLFALGCGLYCFYAFYMLKCKHEIKAAVLLPKGGNAKKCKDYEGYCQEAQKPLLLLSIVVTLYGGIDLYNTCVGGAKTLFLIMVIALLPTLVIYSVSIKKLNEKYF